MHAVAAQLSRQLSLLAETRTDGELLSAFLSDHDESAFAELVRRHGPLVWGACRRLLPDPTDAEDAFQAAFIVLVRRARRLRGQPALGPWLHKVATWTARNIRRRNARMLARRVPLANDASDHRGDSATSDLLADLDAALLALPEKYRTPLILCHLQGWSRRDAAARLGCPEGTLSSLLSRGLARLRAKLGSYDPAKLLSAVAVPAALASATVRAATASRLAAAGVVPASVSQLVEGVIHMFWVKKATASMAGLVVVFGFGLGVGVSVKQAPTAVAGEGAEATMPARAGGKPGQDGGLNALDWFNKRMRQGAPIEAAVRADQDPIKKLEADLARLEERLKRAKDQESELRVRSSLLQQNLQMALGEYDKAEIERATAKLKESNALVIAKRIDVTRLEEDIANLKQRLAAARAAQPKPAPGKPQPSVPIDLKKQVEQLRAQIEKNQIDSQNLEAQREQLRAAQSLLIQKLKELEKQGLAGKARIIPPAVTVPGEKKESLLLSIGAKGMRWVFTVTEHNRDGKRTGTAQFDSAVPLGHYLAGVGKDAKVPKAIRITVAKEVQYADLQEVLDLVKSAGMSVSSVQLSAAGQGGADDALVPWEQLVRDRDEREAARMAEAAELQLLKSELERLKNLKTQPPIDPARP